MIPLLPHPFLDIRLCRIRMHQHRQRAPPHHQPRHKRAKLGRRAQVDLEHAHGVRPDGLVPAAVDAQLGELEADARPEVLGVLDLVRGGLHVVDVHVAGGGGVSEGGWEEGGGTDKPPRMPLSRGEGNWE